MSSARPYNDEGLVGSVESTAGAELFGRVMGIVAATLGLLTLGAYLGRNLSGGAALLCFVLGFFCIVGLNFARGSAGLGLGLLSSAGLLLGLGLGGGLYAYAQASPGSVWRAAAATALFVGSLGSAGYMIRSDVSAGYRALCFLLWGLIVYGLVSLLVAIPNGDLVYSLLGLGIFGGYTLLDFNRMRRAGVDDAIPIATGIFLDVVNVFLFFLRLFGGGNSRS